MSTSYRIFKYEDKEYLMFVYTDMEGGIWYDSLEFSEFLGYDTFPAFLKTTSWKDTSMPSWNYINHCPLIQKPEFDYLVEHSTVPWLEEFKKWLEEDDVDVRTGRWW